MTKQPRLKCCDAMRQHQKEATEDGHNNGALERGADGTWYINGCCGGGCFVVSDIHRCPFCGENLPTKGA